MANTTITNNQILLNAVIQTGNNFPKEVTQAISTALLSQFVTWTGYFAADATFRANMYNRYCDSNDPQKRLLAEILGVINNLSPTDLVKFRKAVRLYAAFAIGGLTTISNRYPAYTDAHGTSSASVVQSMVARVAVQ